MRVITVARKPLSEPSVAENVLKHGTGAINIDATRIAGDVPSVTGQGFRTGKYGGQIGHGETTLSGIPGVPAAGGRWPANVIIAHLSGCDPEASGCSPGCPVADLDAQSGTTRSGVKLPKGRGTGETRDAGWRFREGSTCYADSGGASRFFKQIR